MSSSFSYIYLYFSTFSSLFLCCCFSGLSLFLNLRMLSLYHWIKLLVDHGVSLLLSWGSVAPPPFFVNHSCIAFKLSLPPNSDFLLISHLSTNSFFPFSFLFRLPKPSVLVWIKFFGILFLILWLPSGFYDTCRQIHVSHETDPTVAWLITLVALRVDLRFFILHTWYSSWLGPCVFHVYLRSLLLCAATATVPPLEFVMAVSNVPSKPHALSEVSGSRVCHSRIDSWCHTRFKGVSACLP